MICAGYVSRNLSAPRARPQVSYDPYGKKEEYKARKSDQTILDHERKRSVEVKCFELRDQLEEEGCVLKDTSGKR